MVDQLNAFAAEVTRVAREVGTEGKLGGQAVVPGIAGTWKDLTDSVNVMAANLTDQVRGIVKVVTAVATGNLRQKLTVQAKGEVAALAETINNMTVGAVDYLTKPVNPAVLRSKVNVFVDLFRKTRALTEMNATLEARNSALQREAEERMRRIRAEAARAEAEAANAAKDRFLAMLSHELRTPLTPIIYAVALLEEAWRTKTQQKGGFRGASDKTGRFRRSPAGDQTARSPFEIGTASPHSAPTISHPCRKSEGFFENDLLLISGQF